MWIIFATDLCSAQISRRVSRKKTQNNILIFHESALSLAAAFTTAVTLVLLWVCMLSHCCYVWLFETLWTVAQQAPLSKGFSRQGYWSWLPFPSPGDLPNPGTKPASFICLLHWQAGSLLLLPLGFAYSLVLKATVFLSISPGMSSNLYSCAQFSGLIC